MFTQKKEHIKDMVLTYLREHCMGFRNSKKRKEIIPYLPINISDRLFRKVFSELKHSGEVASHSTLGYWATPYVCDDPEEIQAILLSWKEMKSKALNMLTDADRAIKTLEDKYRATSGKQRVFLTV